MPNISLAGCIIYDDNGDVLMLHRNTQKRTQWEIPGGGVDVGEDADEAAIREVLEELGVTVRIVRELGHREFSEDGNNFDYTWFQAEIIEGDPSIKEPHSYDKFGYLSLITLTRRYD